MEYDRKRKKNISGSSGVVHKAARNNGSECLDYLIRKNMNNITLFVNEFNNEIEKTLPLHYATTGQNTKNMKTLLRYMGKDAPQKKEKKKKDP